MNDKQQKHLLPSLVLKGYLSFSGHSRPTEHLKKNLKVHENAQV